MAKKAMTKKEKNTEVLQIKMTPTVKARLTEEAERRGLAPSQLARMIILDAFRAQGLDRKTKKDTATT